MIRYLFFFCTSLFSVSACFSQSIEWRDTIGVVVNADKVIKTAPDGWGNGGAASMNKLIAGENGWVEYRTDGVINGVAFGLSEINKDAHYNSIDYAILLENNNVSVYENGVLKKTLSNYVNNQDIFRIERTQGNIYYKKNSQIFYTSTTKNSKDLLLDIALLQREQSLREIKIDFPCLLNVTAGPDKIICFGDNTVLEGKATGIGPFTYQWSPAGGLSSTSVARPTASPGVTTTYTLTACNKCACRKDQVTITVNPTITITPSDTAICIGDSVALTASGAVSYTWSSSTGLDTTAGSTVMASPDSTTTYIVTGTDSSGCSNTDTVTITINPLPIVTLSASDSTLCSGDSAVLMADGALNYNWFLITSHDTIEILSSSTWTIELKPDSIKGKDAMLHGLSYLQDSNFGSHQDFIPLAWTFDGEPGIGRSIIDFDLSIIPSNAQVISATLSLYANPTSSMGTHSSLSGSNASWLERIISPWNENAVTWNTQPTTTSQNRIELSESDSSTQNYDVNVKTLVQDMLNDRANSHGFLIKLQTEEHYRRMVFASSDHTDSTLHPKLKIIYAFPDSGNAIVINPPSTGTYLVEGMNANGCKDTASLIITVNSLPSVAVSGASPICEGNSTILTATGAVTYSWSPSIGLNTTAGSTVTASPDSTTTYTVTGTDSSGCSNTDTVMVTVNPLPIVTASASDNVVCLGDSVILTASGAETYEWTVTLKPDSANGKDALLHGLSYLQNANFGSNSDYTAIAWTFNGEPGICRSVVDFDLSAIPFNAHINSATLSLYANPTSSMGTHSSLSGSNTSWLERIISPWNENAVTWNTQPATTSQNRIELSESDSSTQNYDVNVKTLVQDMLNDRANSHGFLIKLQTEEHYRRMVFSSSDHTDSKLHPALKITYILPDSTIIVSPLTTITYVVAGTDSSGCSNTDTVTIIVNPLPVVTASASDSVICQGDSTVLTAFGAATYSWSPSTGLNTTAGSTVTASPASTTTYIVTGTDSLGCSNTAAITVIVNSLPVVSLSSFDSVNINDPAFALTEGSPAGGIYSGTGISNNIFDPAMAGGGTHEIIYTYTDSNFCSGSDTASITVTSNDSLLAEECFSCASMGNNLYAGGTFPDAPACTDIYPYQFVTNLDWACDSSQYGPSKYAITNDASKYFQRAVAFDHTPGGNTYFYMGLVHPPANAYVSSSNIETQIYTEQAITVEPGKIYNVSAWVKNLKADRVCDGCETSVSIYAYGDNIQTNFVSVKNAIKNVDGWVQLCGELSVPQDAGPTAYIGLWAINGEFDESDIFNTISGTDTVHIAFDDIEVYGTECIDTTYSCPFRVTLNKDTTVCGNGTGSCILLKAEATTPDAQYWVNGEHYTVPDGGMGIEIEICPDTSTTYTIMVEKDGCRVTKNFTVTVEDCGCFSCPSAGIDLVTDGNFAINYTCSDQDPSSNPYINPAHFETNHAWACEPSQYGEGKFAVVDDASEWKNYFEATDRTPSGNTNFFIAQNNRLNLKEVQLQKQVAALPGKIYNFSVWVKNINIEADSICNFDGGCITSFGLFVYNDDGVQGRFIAIKNDVKFSDGWVNLCGEYAMDGGQGDSLYVRVLAGNTEFDLQQVSTYYGVATINVAFDDLQVFEANCGSTCTVDFFLSEDVTICTGSSTVLTASGATEYSWSPTTDLFTEDENGTYPLTNPVTVNEIIASPSVTTTYTVTGTLNGCSVTKSVTVTVKNNDLQPGSIAGDQAICNGNIPATLTHVSFPTGGASGNFYVYNWEASIDNGATWTVVGGYLFDPANPDMSSATYSSGPLTTSTYFRRKEFSEGCGFVYSNYVFVEVDAPIVPGTIGSSQDVCEGDVPAVLTELTAASGGNGTYSYQWQSSQDNVNWTDISGATAISYAPPAITSSSYYRRNTISRNCISSSESVFINIVSLLTPGNISEVIENACFPGMQENFIYDTSPTGGNNIYSYQWESSIDNINWVDISGANGLTYTPVTSYTLTYYRRKVTSASCIATTNAVEAGKFVINPGQIGGEQTLCYNSSPAMLTSVTDGSVPSGTVTYQWQSSADNILFLDIPGATSSEYLPTGITETTYYRRNVSTADCKNISTNVISVTIIPEVTLLPYNSVNDTDPDFNLFGGEPAGGTYSGNGVTGNVFSPVTAGIGTHQITYTVTVNGCSGSATQDIIVISPPVYEYTGAPTTGISFNNYGVYVNIISDPALTPPMNVTTINIVGNLLNEKAADNRAFDNSKNGIFNNEGLISLTKDWTNNAGDLFIPVTGKTEFYGENQKIQGTDITQFNDLTLSGTGIKSMYIDAHVKTNLDLQHLEMATRDNTLLIKNPANNAILRTSGFVSSDLFGGKLSREMNNTQPYLFPVGSSLITIRYRPVAVAHSTPNALQYHVRMINNSPDLPLNPDVPTTTHSILTKYQDVYAVNDKYYYLIEKTGGASEPADIGIYYLQSVDDEYQSIAQWSYDRVTPVVFSSPDVPYWKNTINYLGNHAFDLTLSTDLTRYNQFVAANTTPAMNLVTIKDWNNYTDPVFALSKGGFVINSGGAGGFGDPDGNGGDINVNVTGPCPPNTTCNTGETPLNTNGNDDGSGGGVVTGSPLAGTYCMIYNEGNDNTKIKICWDVDTYGSISNVHVVESDQLTGLNYPLATDLYSIINGTTLLLKSTPVSTEINCTSPVKITFNSNNTDPLVLDATGGTDRLIVSGAENDANLKLEIFDQNGTSVFSTTGTSVIDTNGAWDGKIGVDEAPPGVYKLELTHTVVGSTQVFKGQFIVK